MKEYNPAEVAVIVHGYPLSGFADGSFVKVTRDTPNYSDHVGADGEVNRIRSHDKRGAVEVTLKQTSVSNDILSALLVADEASGVAVGPVMIKDVRGTTLCMAAEAWLEGPPEVTFGDAHESRVWKLRCAKLDIFSGGIA